MRRRWRRVIVSLLLGVAMSFVAAVVCSVWPIGNSVFIGSETAVEVRRSFGLGPDENRRHSTLGHAVCERFSVEGRWPAVLAGWPLLSFEAEGSIGGGTSSPAITWMQGGGARQVVIPLRPRLALLPNVLWFALVVFLLLGALSRFRRFRRLRRGRCAWCSYPRGASDRCTECGAAVDEMPRRAARRSLGIGAAALSTGGVIAVTTLIVTIWPERLPSTFLARIASLDADSVGLHELVRRRTNWPRNVAADQAVDRTLLRRYLEHLKKEGRLVRVRDRWPRSLALAVGTVSPSDFRGVGAGRVEYEIGACAWTHLVSLGPVWDGRDGWDRESWRDPVQSIPFHCVVDGTLEITCRVFENDQPRAGDYPIAEDVIRLPVTLVDDIDEVLQPVQDPDVARALREMRIVSLSPLQVRIPVERFPDDVAVGLRVEAVTPHGRGIAGRFWCSERDPSDDGRYRVPGDGALTSIMHEPWVDWYVRVYGDGEMAARDLSRSRYWSGEIRLLPNHILGSSGPEADAARP